MRLNIFFLFFSFFFQTNVIADIHHHVHDIQTDPNALYAFFKEMPKGGELHYHLAGGAYPEAMLNLAQKHGYCLDTKSFSILKSTELCKGIMASDLLSQPWVYEQTIRAWSMKDFIPGKESAHDHFFSSFYKFMPIVADFRPQLLAEIMQRAANQHELYLEIMILPDNAQSANYGALLKDIPSLNDKKKLLLSNKKFLDNNKHTINESRRILQQARHELHCDTQPQQPVCNLTVKFQYYILREQPLDQVFAQALNGFIAASQSPDIIAINLVQAEDGIISLRDYRHQMQIINFLHETYPNVHIALHAGELSPKAVSPDALNFHIHDAVFTGKAERIGHGVDIAYEHNAEILMNHMAKKPIAVEINLTSNQEILNISGVNHPLRYYLLHQVPVVLSTDDEGILRTDLTRQYVEAVLHHGLDYQTIKTINRNALTYSFLPGNSLWSNANQGIPVKVCLNLNSQACKSFIKDNEKARLQWQLETQLLAFEKQYNATRN
ncbi:adenosine deaminase family protein [Legionella oakridgensis]|uniref:adenosine deaminase family protein n=1 Tax=Legionella oakridgensis TaxID=29423 RepID=UPI0003DE4243|nr:adenosine deaminase [Legionella oakridgensis]ETO92524.1 adenosine deaminase [Legionella oakridgensis RV-2-2007]